MLEHLDLEGERPTTGLLDLPNELLERIAKYVSDAEHLSLFRLALVNKRLWTIVSPSMLVRHWPPRRDRRVQPSVEVLARHLLRDPQLCLHVRNIILSDADVANSLYLETLDYMGAKSETLSARTRKMWLDLTQEDNSSDDRLGAAHGGLATLVLSWTTSITDLTMQVPYFEPGTGNYSLPLVLASDVAMKIIAGRLVQTPGASPFVALRYVDIGCSDARGTVNEKWVAPFFYLPKLRTFVGRRLRLRGVDEEPSVTAESPLTLLTDFPSGTSSVEEILLSCTDFTPAGLGNLVYSCFRLRKLVIRDDWVMESADLSTNALAQVILHHKASLEDVCLSLFGWDERELFEDFDDGPIALGDCFHHLENLKCLAIDVKDIRTADDIWKTFTLNRLPGCLEELSADVEYILEEDTGKQRILDVNRLPPSLRVLELSGLGPWANFPVYRKRVTRYMDAFNTLIRECGQNSRFSNLKHVHIPVVDHPTVQGLEGLKELAEVNGVTLSLNHLQVW